MDNNKKHIDELMAGFEAMRRILKAQIFGLEDELAASKILYTFTQLIVPFALSFTLWSTIGWYTGWVMGMAYHKLRPWK